MKMFRRYIYLMVFVMMALIGITSAQAVAIDVTKPATWFESPLALQTLVLFLTPYVNKVLTAFFKGTFNTNGNATIYISLVLSVILGAVGGFLSVGFVATTTGGLQGAFYGAAIALVAFLGSNGMVLDEKQRAKREAEAYEKAKHANKELDL